MELGISEILAGLGILFLFCYYYLTRNFDFWKKFNVPGPKPIPFFGNYKDFVFGKMHIGLLMKKYYDEYKTEPMIGIYGKGSPKLILKEPNLIKDVLIKDFNIFADRGFYIDKNTNPLRQNLINLEYERWRFLRNKLSPVFTSGKIKEMFYLLNDCAHQLEKYLEKIAEKDESTEFRELTAKFTTETIGVCAFGFNTKALNDNDSEFRKFGRALLSTSFINVCRRLMQELFPRIYNFLGRLTYNKASFFFINTMKETLQYRRKNKIRRNDFVDFLRDLQDQPQTNSIIEFTDEFLTGQALVFFVAGFETSATTMSNAFYELALNQDIQDRLREEIKNEFEKNGENITSDSIKNMKYLEKIVKETLRKYPPGSILQRKASAAYTFTGTKVTIPKDTVVIIPVWAIHRDYAIYPKPDVFDPERFNDENEKSRHPMNFLPFGQGPHNCIGARFANFQTKIGIITLIRKFKIDVCNKTCIPYRVQPRSIIPAPIGGIHLKITKL